MAASLLRGRLRGHDLPSVHLPPGLRLEQQQFILRLGDEVRHVAWLLTAEAVVTCLAIFGPTEA